MGLKSTSYASLFTLVHATPFVLWMFGCVQGLEHSSFNTCSRTNLFFVLLALASPTPMSLVEQFDTYMLPIMSYLT
jgi:hypothetical protein